MEDANWYNGEVKRVHDKMVAESYMHAMGKGFVWTDSLVAQYGEFYRQMQGTSSLWGKDIMEEFKKSKRRPPQGITPRWVLAEQRISEIKEAQARYEKEEKEIPVEWSTELSQLLDYMIQRECKSPTKATDDVRERIKSFRHRENKSHVTYFHDTKHNFGLDDAHTIYPKQYFLDRPTEYEIYSVLSKNNVEVNVGDYVALRWRDEVALGKISHFTYCEPANIIDIYLEGETTARTTRHFTVEKTEEKKVLFTTEDGVDIFDSDEYWLVYPHELNPVRTDALGGSAGNILRNSHPEHKRFSTKEAAEQWIACNQKSISFKELEDFLADYRDVVHKNAIERHFKPKESATK